MTAVAISFVVYTLAIGLLGIYSARFAKPTDSDFLLADRGLGPWVAGLSAAASAESGWVTLGLVGTAYKTGIGTFWLVPATGLAFLFNWFVLGPKLRRASVNQNSLTVVDVIAGRYSTGWANCIRFVGIVIVLAMLTAYVAAQLNSAGKTFTGTFNWSYSSGVLVGMGIILLYTLIGGFRAVSWTDVVQAIFMIAAVTFIPLLLINRIGGWGVFWEKLNALEDAGVMTSLFADKSGWALCGFLALWLGIPLGNSGQPHSLIRLMAARDDRAIRRGGLICTFWVMLLFSGAILTGIAAKVHFGFLEDPENAMMKIATDGALIHGLLGGLFVAAILAAICSTADSQLLVSASAVSHDFMERLLGIELSMQRRRIVERLALLLVAIVAAVIALGDVRSVFDFVLAYGWAGLGAGLGPALILTLLWPRTTGPAVLVGMVAGVSIAVVWRQFPELNATVYNLVPAFFGSLLIIIGLSYFTAGQTLNSDETPSKKEIDEAL